MDNNFTGGYEHHSQADSFKDYLDKMTLKKPQQFIEYRYINGKWQARLNHLQTPQQALEEEPVKWETIE